MSVRFRALNAAEDGLIFGIKWGVAALVFAALNFAWAGDYWNVRQGAAHGEQVYRVVLAEQQKAAQQRQQQQAGAPSNETP